MPPGDQTRLVRHAGSEMAIGIGRHRDKLYLLRLKLHFVAQFWNGTRFGYR